MLTFSHGFSIFIGNFNIPRYHRYRSNSFADVETAAPCGISAVFFVFSRSFMIISRHVSTYSESEEHIQRYHYSYPL